MYFRTRIPPPNTIYKFEMNNFAGGLNNASRQLEENEATDLLNVLFSDETLVVRREGLTPLADSTLPAPITHTGFYRPYTDPEVLIRATSTTVYAGSTSIATVAGNVNGVTYMGMYVFADGDAIRFYGKFPQADSANVDVIGPPINDYVTLKLVNPPTGFTPLPNPATQGVWKYDYVTLTLWYEPCAYEVADTHKGSNVIPEKAKYVCVHGDRLYISGAKNDNDNVFISDVSNGMYFAVYLPIQLPPNGDEVRGLKSFHDSVVVGREHDMHAIYGNTNRTDLNAQLFRLKRLNTHTGIANQRAIEIVNNYLFYLGADGVVYAMYTTNTDTNTLMTQIISGKLDLLKHPISVSKDDIKSASSQYFEDNWYLAVGDKVLVYSYKNRAWTMLSFTGINITSMHVRDFALEFAGNTGKLYGFQGQYMDDGQPYTSFFTSKWFDISEPSTFKHLRDFYIVSEVYEDFATDIRVKFEVDYADVVGEFEFKNLISRWGISLFGQRFINRNINESVPMFIGKRCRSFRITFTNGRVKDAEVPTEADLFDVPEKRVGMMVLVTSTGDYYVFEPDFTWRKVDSTELNQPMRLYEINGEYEFRRKR